MHAVRASPPSATITLVLQHHVRQNDPVGVEVGAAASREARRRPMFPRGRHEVA
jgi:hypothetical protein